MYKFLFVFILFFFQVGASELEDKIEIFATDIDTQNSIVEARGDIAVTYKGYYLTASRAKYNKLTGQLELFENVRANQGSEYKLLGNYATLNVQNKEKSFKPFYMLEQQSQVWLSGKSCEGKENDLFIESGVVSGCNPSDPVWKIEFTSSDYNTDSKWLNLYNARLYLFDIPVLYTPWFGYPLDKTRRSGLLKPSFGVSGVEGVYFEQPLYIAEYDEWDLELKPQIRTKRGHGAYSKFRFTDSEYSQGSFTAGYFKEKQDYFLSNTLANDKHYGYNLKYENTDVLNQWFGTKLSGQSGLYVDGSFMNDVDYINLASNETINVATTTQVFSRINAFYNTDRNYFATYFKHTIDLSKESNENTLQKLPTFHYHHYLETLLDNHLSYNVDLQSNYIHREINKKVLQTDVNIPLTLHTSLFDEYVDLDYTTFLYAQNSSFSGSEKIPTGVYRDGTLARNSNVVSISSELVKGYENFSHVVSFGTSYTFKGAETSNGFYFDYKDYCNDENNFNDPNYNSRCEFYSIAQIKEELKLDFSQYLYDALGKQILYHRLSQSILYTGIGSSKGDLENELEYSIFSGLDFYNNMFYNHKQERFSKIYNSLVYNDEAIGFSLSHLFQDSFIPATTSSQRYTDYLTTSLEYKYSKYYSYRFVYDYDLELEKKKRTEIGFVYRKRCWDFGLKYVENNRPVLDISGQAQGIKERYVYFTISLKPFMSTGSTDSSLFAYKLPDDK